MEVKMRTLLNSIYDNDRLMEFFEAWEGYNSNPFPTGGAFDVEMYDDSTGDRAMFKVWAESEDFLREDIYNILVEGGRAMDSIAIISIEEY
jgi:hypothetical protein